jgi:hypothetical protein
MPLQGLRTRVEDVEGGRHVPCGIQRDVVHRGAGSDGLEDCAALALVVPRVQWGRAHLVRLHTLLVLHPEWEVGVGGHTGKQFSPYMGSFTPILSPWGYNPTVSPYGDFPLLRGSFPMTAIREEIKSFKEELMYNQCSFTAWAILCAPWRASRTG